MTCVMKGEAWPWCLPIHLVVAKFVSSRCETCINDKYLFYAPIKGRSQLYASLYCEEYRHLRA